MELLRAAAPLHRQPLEVKETPGGGDTCFKLVSFIYNNLVKTFFQVDFGEDPATSNLLGEVQQVRQRE